MKISLSSASILAVATILISIFVSGCVSNQARPESDSADIKTTAQNSAPAQSPVQGDWAADKKGCKVWNPAPQPNETITWSGKCTKGYASGKGAFKWFKNGQLNGEYIGSMHEGRFHGKGKIKWANGDSYEGDFVDGKQDGKGKMTWSEESQKKCPAGVLCNKSFEGTFVRDERRCGKSFYTNGDEYEGCMEMQANGKYKLMGKTKFQLAGKYSGGTNTAAGSPSGEPTAGDFVFDSKFGMFLDRRSNLTWRRCSLGRKWDERESKCIGKETRATWGEMVALARKDKYAGFSDWRLPSVEEYARLFPKGTHYDCGRLKAAIPKLFPNIYNEYLFGSNHWLADNSKDLMHPFSANMEPSTMSLVCRFAATEIRPHGKQPAMLVRGGSVPKEWTAALAANKLTAQVNKESEARGEKYWNNVGEKIKSITSGSPSNSSSSSGSKYFKCTFRCVANGLTGSQSGELAVTVSADESWQAESKAKDEANKVCDKVRGSSILSKDQATYPSGLRCRNL